MESFIQDLRYAVRQLVLTPAFTVVAVLTLAVGIGANTALFTMFEAIFVRPLPGVSNDGRLVWIAPYAKRAGHAVYMSYPDFVAYRNATDVFANAAAVGRTDFALSTGGTPVRVTGGVVSGSYFSLLGVKMARGRGFTPDEDRTPGTHPVAVISFRTWQERLGGDPNVIGKAIVVNGAPFTVVGVTPEQFNGVEHELPLEIWVPMMMQPQAMPQTGSMLDKPNSWWLRAVGQLKPGVSLEHAKAAVATIGARIAKADSAEHGDVVATAERVSGGMTPGAGQDVIPVAFLSAAATALILLICCANVSNMLLARAVGRRREIGVRLSLGASRSRVVRQLLTEATLLALVAGGAGLLIALWATDLLARTIPVSLQVTPNRTTLAFAIAAALVTGMLFSLVPSLHATRGDLASALRDSVVGLDRRRSRLQNGFVITQLSLSLVLLVTAGMFLSSLYRSTKLDVGFEATSHVLAASFDLGLQNYTAEKSTTFVNELESRVRALAGVADVTVTNNVPMGERRIGNNVTLDPREAQTPLDRQAGDVYDNIVRPGFFKTLGIGIVRGRDFAATDGLESERVAIVSEDFARRAWPGADPIGKHISERGPDGPFMTVIGVVREAMTYGVSERRRPTVYRSQLQFPKARDLTLLVRSSGDAALLARPVTNVIHALDRNLPVFGVETLAQYRRDRLFEPTLGSTVLAIVGGLALLLACVGVYSVIAFAVGQRMKEIGLRIALGAASEQVVKLFVRQGVRLIAIGLVIGLALSAVMAALLSASFVGISTIDSLAFVGVAALLAAVGAGASWIPARRAARVDPMVALRAE
jgi:predicted permease